MIPHRDEILRPAVSTDSTAVPRYNLVRPDGTIIEKNVAMRLSNPVAQAGTPISKAALDEMLAASGVTAGTATAYTLAQEEYTLFDGAPVRFRLHTASGDGATLNINGTGAKPLIGMMGAAMPGGVPAGTWITAYYSAVAGAYVLAGGEAIQALYGERYTVDDAVAHIKDVPADALPVAEIGEIGGMTRKCTNKLNLSNCSVYNGTIAGETIKSNINNDSYATIRNENVLVDWVRSMAGKEITFSVKDNHNRKIGIVVYGTREGGATYQEENAANRVVTLTVATDFSQITAVELRINRDTNNFTDTETVFEELMLNEGTAHPYEPYFEGLRSAAVSEAKSGGVNLIPYPYAHTTFTANGVTFTDNGDGSITINGTPTKETGFAINYNDNPVDVGAGTYYASLYTDKPASAYYYWLASDGQTISTNTGKHTFSDAVTLGLCALVVYSGTTYDNVIVKPMLNRGTTAKPYTPYFHDTLTIPEAVRALDGYGESNPDDATEYNAIKWLSNGRCIYSHKGNIVDGAWVPLAKEEVTDISDLLPADNLLPVEAGGTITAVNEYGYAVPTKITYQRDVLANRASTFALEKLRLAMELLASIDKVTPAVSAAIAAAVAPLAKAEAITAAIDAHKAESAAHNAASIVTDTSRQFVTAAEKAAWNAGGGSAKILSNTRITSDSNSITINLPTDYNYFRIILSDVATTDTSLGTVRGSINANSLNSSGMQLGAGDSDGAAFVMSTESTSYLFAMVLADDNTFGAVSIDIARHSGTIQGTCSWVTDGNGNDANVGMAMHTFSASDDATTMTISMLGSFYLRHGMGILVLGAK